MFCSQPASWRLCDCGVCSKSERGSACAQALLPLFTVRLRRFQAPQFMALTFLVLVAVFPATWHAWAERRSGNANHLFAVALLFGFWQARAHTLLQASAHGV